MRFAFFNKTTMENLIDETYFIDNLAIPGISVISGGTVQSAIATKRLDSLRRFISIHQKDYLKRMFGKTIANAESLPQYLQDLLIDSANFRSPLANYVYFFWMRKEASMSTPVGEKINNTDNTVAVTTLNKQAYAWNEMVDLNKMIHEEMAELEEDGFDYVDLVSEINCEDGIFEYIHNSALIV